MWKKKDYLIELNTWKKRLCTLNKSMVNLLLNDDQTVPTTAVRTPLGLQMIAMEVADFNDHVYTLVNYCAFVRRGSILYAEFGAQGGTS